MPGVDHANRRSVTWRRGIGALLTVIGFVAAALTVAIYWTTDPAFAHHNCDNRFNTDGELGAPLGYSDRNPAVQYTLIPFQITCEWKQFDGTEVQSTHIELGTAVPVTSLVGFAGGLALLLSTVHRPKE
jgi:hypothetical protein